MSPTSKRSKTTTRSTTSKTRGIDFAVGLVAACCVVSATMNFYHLMHEQAATSSSNPALHHDSSAIHPGIKSSFQVSLKRTKGKHIKEQEERVGAEEKENIREEKPHFEESKTNVLGTLSCEKYGGPSALEAQEMVYWHNIPSDERYKSPFRARKGQQKKFMTFEPDGGGWNNIRMAMETVLGLAIAMGRTLVMPPDQRMYLLSKNRGKEKTDFSFADFFPMQELASENDGLEIITMQQFLEEEAMTGKLIDIHTGEPTFPPGNRTDWNGQDVKPLKEWLRNSTHAPLWSPNKCMAAFPASGNHEDTEVLKQMIQKIHNENLLHRSKFLDDPPPVDAEPIERLRENIIDRKELCVYDEEMQREHVLHFMCYHKMKVRMLVHFYAFLFFEDWREDLWMKRFMRDHVRYIDEIQCAAARVVARVRQISKQNGNQGEFDSYHVRRGDFQYKDTRIPAKEILSNTEDILEVNSTIFIATDERDKNFFAPFREKYNVLFLDDFMDELKGVNTNYYGMIDQLVASRGRNFFGCWHST